MSERKTTEIKLRVTPTEKTSWQFAAEQREVGLSQFIRDCVSESVRTQWNHPLAQGFSDDLPRGGFWHEEGEAENIGAPDPPLSPETVEGLREQGVDLPTWRPTALHARVEDSSIEQPVPTSDEVGRVAKPWTFEGRNSE